MKKYFTLIILAFVFQSVFGQNEGYFRIEKNTVFYNENNQQISQTEFLDRMSNEDLQLSVKKDSIGKTKAIRIENKAKKLPYNPKKLENQKAPDFIVTDMAGRTIDSKKLRGKIIVLNFWFTSCMPCIEEIPSLNSVRNKYQNNPNVIFLAITFNRKSNVKKFIKYHPMLYTIVPFDNPTCREFNIKGFPTNIIIDKNGNYQWISLGGHVNIGAEIEIQIEKALQK